MSIPTTEAPVRAIMIDVHAVPQPKSSTRSPARIPSVDSSSPNRSRCLPADSGWENGRFSQNSRFSAWS